RLGRAEPSRACSGSPRTGSRRPWSGAGTILRTFSRRGSSRRGRVRRTLLASLLPAAVITAAWLSLEDPRRVAEGVAVACLALLPALVRRRAARILAIAGATAGAAWIAFGAQP